MMRDNSTLLDIAQAANLVGDFIADMEKKEFLKDIKTKSSVLYQLVVIGEAVKRLSREFREQNAGIPWSLIAGMRDHLIHGYDIVDWDEVWKTATLDLQELLKRIEPLLPRKT